MDKAIKLKPVRSKDESFLKRVYTHSRDREMQATGWPSAQQKAFLESQFALRSLSYAANHPGAEHQIIMYKTRPIGVLQYAVSSEALELIDIAILRSARGKGIGTRIISDLCLKAQARNVPVKLTVQADNLGAKQLYEKLGFVKTSLTGPNYQMVWTPET